MSPGVALARTAHSVVRIFAVLALAVICAPAAAQQTVLIFGYDASTRHLVRFFSDAPGTVLSDVPISGLQSGENIDSMDFRPATGELYAIAATGTTARLVKIDTVSAALTQVGASFAVAPGTVTIGMAFSPTADRIRIVSTATANQRIDANTGALFPDAAVAYAAGDVNAGKTPGVAFLAYSNHYLGATTSTAYAIDTDNNVLVRIGGIGGSPSPNGGQLTTIGPLGVVAGSTLGGLAIQPGTNTAYATLDSTIQKLYSIRLDTGAVTLVGNIGSISVAGIAIAPASPCLDIDGDGRVDALTDGLVLLRAIFGLSGTSAISGAVPASSPRTTWAAIRAHLNANCGLHLPP